MHRFFAVAVAAVGASLALSAGAAFADQNVSDYWAIPSDQVQVGTPNRTTVQPGRSELTLPQLNSDRPVVTAPVPNTSGE